MWREGTDTSRRSAGGLCLGSDCVSPCLLHEEAKQSIQPHIATQLCPLNVFQVTVLSPKVSQSNGVRASFH